MDDDSLGLLTAQDGCRFLYGREDAGSGGARRTGTWRGRAEVEKGRRPLVC